MGKRLTFIPICTHTGKRKTSITKKKIFFHRKLSEEDKTLGFTVNRGRTKTELKEALSQTENENENEKKHRVATVKNLHRKAQLCENLNIFWLWKLL